MEALTTIAIFLAVMGVIVAVSYHYTYIAEPRKRTPQIIAALEENERIGLSDIDTDIRRTAARWGLLNMGSKEAKRFKVEAYSTRIATQIAILAPRGEELQRERLRIGKLEAFIAFPVP